LDSSQKILTKFYSENTTETIIFANLVGTTGTQLVDIVWIDRTPPTCEVVYSTTGFTNQNVNVRLGDCSKPITLTSPDAIYTFTGNGSYTFSFVDNSGNTGNATAMVTWIDKSPVTGNITYNITERTNQDVTATISFNKTDVTILNNSGVDYLFIDNGVFIYRFIDKYGNEGEATAAVSWMDLEPPFVTSITYTPNSHTNQPVTVEITLDKQISGITGWIALNTENTIFSKTYTSNTEEVIYFYDHVNNE